MPFLGGEASVSRMKLFSHNISLRFILRLFFAILFLVPIIWMVSASLRPTGIPLSTTLQFSQGITFENFSRIWELVPMGKFALNSLAVVGLAVPITIIISSWAGFSISQMPLASQRRWLMFSLAVLMVPGIALWFSRFIIYKELGWHNTILALIAPAFMGTSPFYMLMFYRAFRRIPYEIIASARLDGADAFVLWQKIALPIAKPTAIGVGLLSFLVYWGDYISPLLYLRTENKYTLAIALQLLQQLGSSDWSLLMAAAVFMTAIPLALFIFVQRFFKRQDF